MSDTMIKVRGNSPIYIDKSPVQPQQTAVPRMNWQNQGNATTPPVSSASSSPNPMPVLTTQLQIRGQQSGQVHVQQPNMPGQPNHSRLNFSNPQMRPVQRLENYNTVMARRAASPFSAPPPPTASPLGQSPLNRASVPSPLSQSVPSPMPVNPSGQPHPSNQTQGPNPVTMNNITMVQDGLSQQQQNIVNQQHQQQMTGFTTVDISNKQVVTNGRKNYSVFFLKEPIINTCKLIF